MGSALGGPNIEAPLCIDCSYWEPEEGKSLLRILKGACRHGIYL